VEGIAVAILKVLGMALAIGMLFWLAAAALTVAIEKSVGQSAIVFQVGVACAGALLGGVAGAAQAVVDAITDARQK
jgi:hypothetical protein